MANAQGITDDSIYAVRELIERDRQITIDEFCQKQIRTVITVFVCALEGIPSRKTFLKE